MKPGLIFEMRWKMILDDFRTAKKCAAFIRADFFHELSNKNRNHTLSVINRQMVCICDLS